MGFYRLILAISVIVAHSGPVFGLTFVDPQTAVQAFFVVSGFYMSLILNEKYVGHRGAYWLFFSNRLLRLLPLYWLTLLLTMVTNAAFVFFSHGEHLGVFRAWVDNATSMS